MYIQLDMELRYRTQSGHDTKSEPDVTGLARKMSENARNNQ